MRNERGSSLVETLCVMALLLLFGITTFTLVIVGRDSYSRLMDKRDATSALRIATGYLSMRVRQFDVSNGIAVEENEYGRYLVLYEDIEGESYETRIYLYNGVLSELFMPSSDEFFPESGMTIVALDSLSITESDDGIISFEVSYKDRRRSLSLYAKSA